jgi:hypothetical protein
MPEPHLRAADVDRTAVATVLGEHMSAGRLTVDEYDERLGRAYAAKTYGELAELTADLPTTRPHARTEATPYPSPMCGPGNPQSSWRAWLGTSLIVVTIWLATSLASWELHYFWPVWVIGPWGAILLAQALTGGKGAERAQPHRRIQS